MEGGLTELSSARNVKIVNDKIIAVKTWDFMRNSSLAFKGSSNKFSFYRGFDSYGKDIVFFQKEAGILSF
jgi:hypothetical protein